MTSPDDQQQFDLTRQSMASKKMRMTLACVRCRLKKVKCDFAHPSCTRCTQAKAPCSYEGSSTQVDLFNIVKLNDIVGTLQQRVQSLESTISDIHQTTQTATDQLNERNSPETTTTIDGDKDIVTAVSRSIKDGKQHSHSPHQWSLSLTSTGLRIDTNIVSLPNLYDILLSGVSQLDLKQDISTGTTLHDGGGSVSSSTCTSPLPSWSATDGNENHGNQQQHQQQQSGHETTDKCIMVERKTPLWRSKYTSFPLYNTWWPTDATKEQKSQHRHIRRPASTTLFILDEMIEIYNECFICLPDTGYEGTIGERYHQGRLDSFLANAIFAWSARHGAVFHNLYPGQDPNTVGECYFDAAKDLLKDRFMIPSLDTLHGLLVLYLYAIGRPPRSNGNDKTQPQPQHQHQQPYHQQQQQGAVEAEAYIFLGLAIRMCLDLKLHKEKDDALRKSENDNDGNDNDSNDLDMDVDKTDQSQENDTDSKDKRMQNEHHRRYFWALYFLETLCSLHCDRPFSLPSEDQITVDFPDVIEENEIGERRYRTEYMIRRFRITQVYRAIIQWTSQDKLLLSSVMELDSRLCEWYNQLPTYLQYEQGDVLRRNWRSTSWREQSCVKLNFEYHFQRSQLYAVFLKRQYMDDDSNSKRIGVAMDDSNGEGENGDGDNDSGDQSKNTSSTFERKAKMICVKSAVMTAELMECWGQLQQRWCHFSLESLMMAVNIFEMLLKDKGYVEQAVLHLTTMLNVLQVSSIQHHPYVLLVITRIQQLVNPTKTGVPGNNSTIIKSTFSTNTAVSKPNEREQQHYQQPPLRNDYHYIHPQHNTTHQYQPPLLQQKQQQQHQQQFQQQQQRSMVFYNPFQMPKSDGMVGASLNDLPFSDFLYNPVMEIPSPFGTYTTTTQGTFHPQQNGQSMTSLSAIPLSAAGGEGVSSVAGTSSSSSSSSLASSSVSPPPPHKGTTTTPLISYPQDCLQPPPPQEMDYPSAAASLWTTLHQSTYTSNELDSSLDYIPSAMPVQQQQQHQQQRQANPFDTTNSHHYHHEQHQQQHSNERPYPIAHR